MIAPAVPCRSTVVLRDFAEKDRKGFVGYQMDSRYRRLYDYDDDPGRAHELFDLFASWRVETPRTRFQYGVFDRATDAVCGSAGVRQRTCDPRSAAIGIELSPENWGRFRVAVTVLETLVAFGFEQIGYERFVWDTSSGNHRVEKLSRWFGAHPTERRQGPEWMTARGWDEVVWTLERSDWMRSGAAAGRGPRTGIGRAPA